MSKAMEKAYTDPILKFLKNNFEIVRLTLQSKYQRFKCENERIQNHVYTVHTNTLFAFE